MQDTGFCDTYPAAHGLIPFRTIEDAVRGAEAIASDYDTHARAARALAEELFDSDKVLTALLREVGDSGLYINRPPGPVGVRFPAAALRRSSTTANRHAQTRS